VETIIIETTLLALGFVSQGGHNSAPQTEWLKPQKFIASLFWRSEVQNQDAGRATLPVQELGKNLCHATFLALGGLRQSLAIEESLQS
jgi:hypothetical protein